MRMHIFKGLMGAGALCAAVMSTAVPLTAQSSQLTMLKGLTKGEWTVRYRDGSQPQKVCVREGDELIQLRHEEKDCRRIIVEDEASRVKVRYTCPGNGYGNMDIRRETGALVQIYGDGIAEGLPFQFAAEARRTGTCATP